MRFDTPVYFQRITAGDYDPVTGNYEEDVVTEVKKYAAVTATSVDTLKIVYGELKQGTYAVRLQRPYKEPFDRIRMGEKVYRVDYEHPLISKQVFVMSEVQ